MRVQPGLLIVPWVVLGLGCSTLAPKPEPTNCSSSADCAEDEVCQGGFCRDATAVPPSRYVGFNLEEQTQSGAGYRVEVAGCDEEVDPNNSTGIEALEVPRGQMTVQLGLRLFRPGFEPDDVVLDDMLDANFELSQSSRFGREPLLQTATAPATVEGTETVLPTIIRWPRYHPYEPIPPLPEQLGPRAHILWKIEPLEPAGAYAGSAAPFYVNLTPWVADGLPECAEGNPDCTLLRTCTSSDLECCPPDQTCEPEDVRSACVAAVGASPPDGLVSGVCRSVEPLQLNYDKVYETACDRAVRAEVVLVDRTTLEPRGGVPMSEVTLRYADQGSTRLGLPVFADYWPPDVPQCQRDDQCVEGSQFCNLDTNHCEVALAGLEAGGGSTDEASELLTRVFTYCDPDVGNVPVERSYTVRVDPPIGTGLPAMTYDVDVEFVPPTGGSDPGAVDLGTFCIPELGALSEILVTPGGEPATLATSSVGDFTCCDIGCLPQDPGTAPPRVPSSCGAAGVSLTATAPISLSPQELEQWESSSCVVPKEDANGNIAVVSRSASCPATDDEPCTLGVSLEYAQEYSVRITSPIGSVLQSVDTTLAIPLDHDPTQPIAIELPPRPLVRGRVTLPETLCDPREESDGDCGSEGAQILAERLRMQGETTANTPGPYFHQVSTFHDPEVGDGAYVLPLDPGVWVLTALPESGTAGGPAPFFVVTVPPEGESIQNFTLEPGVLVTLDLATFEPPFLVTPLDIGSWLLQPGLLLDDPMGGPARPLDLMAPGECLGDSTRGCTIRRLVPGTGLSPNQVGQVRFTARDLGSQARVCSTL